MNKLHFPILLASLLMAMGLGAKAQQPQINLKLIAVVNRANWCAVCKANGGRFGSNISPYAAKDIKIVMNDLTNDSTIAASKAELKKLDVYKQVYTTSRKGVGKMMQSCGLVSGKDKQMVSGIVTFIDAKTLKVLKETSIAVSDQEMKALIDQLLNSRS